MWVETPGLQVCWKCQKYDPYAHTMDMGIGFVKTRVEISDSLFQEARACADSRAVPFRQLVEEGLRIVTQKERQPRKQFRRRDGAFGGQGLPREMSWVDIRKTIYKGHGE